MGRLALLIEPQEGADTAALEAGVRRALRTELSPRHVPDDVVFVPSIPRNPSGKRLELPLKRVIQGAVMGDALDPGVLLKPEDVTETVRLIKVAFADRDEAASNKNEAKKESIRS